MSDNTNSDARKEEELHKSEDVTEEKTDQNNPEESSDTQSSQVSSEEAPKEDWKNKYYYVLAEMDNSRKRFQRERENLIKYGNEKILSNLIEVVDNFDHSIKALESDQDPKVKNILNGIEMVRKLFVEVLSKEGLSRIDSVGQDFDPNFHEAMAKQQAEGKRENEVIFEYQKGYLLNGRLLRPAKVIVAEVIAKEKE